jgi:hypothetical protein
MALSVKHMVSDSRRSFRGVPYALLATVIMALMLSACQTSNLNPEPSFSGFDYYPITVGRFTEYAVSETTYVPTSTVPSVINYHLREVIEDSVVVNGAALYRLERFKRASSAATWNIDSVWSVRRTATALIRTENNQSLIRLIFPVSSQTWDGYALTDHLPASNPDGRPLFSYQNIGQPYTFSNQSFARTVTVLEARDESILGKIDIATVYASEVGIVERRTTAVRYRQPPEAAGISNGRVTTQQLTAHGQL